MLVIKSMQWRRWCQVTACRRPLQVGAGSRWHRAPVQKCVGGAAAKNSRCSSTYHQAPTAFCPPNIKTCLHQQRRAFSKFSTDEVVTPTAAASSAGTTTQAPTVAAKTASLERSEVLKSSYVPPQMIVENNAHEILPSEEGAIKDLLVELEDASELFHQIYKESKALLRNNQSATSSDEVVAMVDYFMILVNSLEVEKYLEKVQAVQNARTEIIADGKQNSVENNFGEEGGVDEKLGLAMKSMSQLHHVLLSMVESCLPLYPPILSEDVEEDVKGKDTDDPSFDKELYCSTTVQRAMQLSQRAEELGLPLHRPLYQRLAVGVVLASPPVAATVDSPPSDSSGDVHLTSQDVSQNEAKEPTNNDETTPLLRRQRPFEKMNRTQHKPQIVIKLMEVFQHARSAHKMKTTQQLGNLAEDLFAQPFLLLLKARQWEDAVALLHEWDGILGGSSRGMNLIGMMGENHTLDAAKGWLSGDKFEEEVQTNSHVIELTGLFEVALSEIMKERKQRADDLSQMLSQFSVRTDDGEFSVDDDSEYEFEIDFDYDTDEELETPTPTDLDESGPKAALGESKSEQLPAGSSEDNDNNTMTLSSNADGANSKDHEEEDEKSTILKGFSDKEVRKSMYVRNGTDWVLPDIVPQLEGWNKGNQLTFTPEFEKYLGQQIMKGWDDDEDED